jgi:hypothetical protein
MRTADTYGWKQEREWATIMITTMVTIIMQVKSKFVPLSKHHTKAYGKSRVKFPCTLLSVLDRGKGPWQYSQLDRWLGRPKGSCRCKGKEKSYSSRWHNPGCQSLITSIIDCRSPAVWGPTCSTCRAVSPLPVVLSNIPRMTTRSSNVTVSTKRHFSKRVRVFHSVVPWKETETDKSTAYLTKASHQSPSKVN